MQKKCNNNLKTVLSKSLIGVVGWLYNRVPTSLYTLTTDFSIPQFWVANDLTFI